MIVVEGAEEGVVAGLVLHEALVPNDRTGTGLDQFEESDAADILDEVFVWNLGKNPPSLNVHDSSMVNMWLETIQGSRGRYCHKP